MKRFNISHEYDFELSQKGVYAAQSERISQICAFLNPVRYKLSKKLDASSEIKLSPGWVLFWYLGNLGSDVLAFAENKKSVEKALDFLELSMKRMFNFDDFRRVINEHGLVPASAMPDAAHHHKSDAVYVFENRLRLGIKQLLDGSFTADEIKGDLYAVLSDGLGEIPDTFDFSYLDSNGELKTLKALTPVAFFKDCCDTDVESYATLRTSVDGAKKAVARQIENGEQVVVLCDLRHQSNQMLGILDTDFLDNDAVFGSDINIPKDEKLALGIIKPTAYLSLDGVAFDENKNALRFKAQDSHGSDTGADGHYTMSSAWFDAYVLSAIVNKKYL